MAVLVVDAGSGAPGDAVALALAVDLHADARGLVLLGVHRHDVGEVDRPLLLDHAAYGLVALGVTDLLRALVALDDVQALHVDLLLLGVDAEHAAGLPAVLATDDDHGVVSPDAGHVRCSFPGPRARGGVQDQAAKPFGLRD